MFPSSPDPTSRHTRARAALVLALVIPAPSVGAAMALWIAPGPVGAAWYAAGKVWLYGLPLVWIALVERRRIRVSRPSTTGVLAGTASGLVIVAAVAALWLAVGDTVDPDTLRVLLRHHGLDTPGSFLAAAAYMTLVNSLLEEAVFRGFMVRRFGVLLPPAWAVTAAALAFTVHHVIVLGAFFGPGLTAAASTAVFLGGMLWGAMWWRFRSLAPCWISHALADAAVMTAGWQLMFAPGGGP